MSRLSWLCLLPLALSPLALGQSTTTAVSASATTLSAGSPLTLSATVQSATTGSPSGAVTFLDGSTALGTSTLTPSSSLSAPVTLASAGVNINAAAAGTLVSVDLNGDGKPDLLSYSKTAFQVFLNNGNGTYTALATETYQLITPGFLDVNQDGKIDIVAVAPSGTGIEALAGNGAGFFSAPVMLSGVSPQVYASSQQAGDYFSVLAVTDLDGDGLPDLVAGGITYENGVQYATASTFKNNGNGTFTFTSTQPTLGPSGASLQKFPATIASLQAIDVTGDGRPDVLLVASSYAEAAVFVLPTLANGTLAAYTAQLAPQPYCNGVCTAMSVAAGDFRHIGKIDLAIASQPTIPAATLTNLTVYPGNGDGTYGTAKVMGTTNPVPANTTINYSAVIAALDLNGDGTPDLIDSYGFGYLSNGDDTFAPTSNLAGYSASNTCSSNCSQVLPLLFNSDSATDVYLSVMNGVLLGSQASSTATLPGYTRLAAGAHSITANYAGSGSFTGSTSSPVVVTVNPLPTTLSVTVSPNPVAISNNFTVTATITTSNSGAATGTVTFSVAGSSVATGTVSGNKVTYTGSLSIVGSQTITATYNGDSTYGTSNGSVTVTSVPGFMSTGGATGPALTASYGGTAQTVISLTGENGFSGTAALACTGLPVGLTCSFSPTSVTISGNAAATSMLTVTAATTVAALSRPQFMGSRNEMLLALLLLPFAGLRIRRRRSFGIALAAILSIAVLGLAGCASGATTGGGGTTTLAPQTDTFNVVATSGSYQVTIAYTINLH